MHKRTTGSTRISGAFFACGTVGPGPTDGIQTTGVARSRNSLRVHPPGWWTRAFSTWEESDHGRGVAHLSYMCRVRNRDRNRTRNREKRYGTTDPSDRTLKSKQWHVFDISSTFSLLRSENGDGTITNPLGILGTVSPDAGCGYRRVKHHPCGAVEPGLFGRFSPAASWGTSIGASVFGLQIGDCDRSNDNGRRASAFCDAVFGLG